MMIFSLAVLQLACISLIYMHLGERSAAFFAVLYSFCNFLYQVSLDIKQARGVYHPPSWSLRRFAELFYSTKTFTEVFEPTLSDLQKEHFEALAAGRLWQARMALVRGYWAFWLAVAAQLPVSLIRLVYEVWKTTKTGP